MLTALLLIPVAGAIALLFIRRDDDHLAALVSRLTTGLMFALGVILATRFEPGPDGFAYSTQHAWLSSLGASYSVGLDGLSLVLVLLAVFLAPITSVASESAISSGKRNFFFWFLILQAAIIGALISRDLLLFFLFWELMLIPMALMIGIWGSGNRFYASLKFFLFTALGSLPMLAAIVWLAVRYGLEHGAPSLAIDDLRTLQLTSGEQFWCFLAFGLSFAIKVPLWPFHTWLPDAHTEAPTPGSVILAGVLLKMGTYGFLRMAIPLFPDAAVDLAPVIDVLAIIAIVVGSLVAMVQEDVKRLVAYSSVAHMGVVMLGIFSLNEASMAGGVYQMLAHGLSTGALFILVGMLYERRHTRLFSEFGGIAQRMPVFAACFVFTTLASIALPGLCGFIGEFLVLAGSWAYQPVFTVFAVLGAILGAWYMLRTVRRLFFGPLTNPANEGLQDLTPREMLIIAPLLVAMLWLGVASRTWLQPIEEGLKPVRQALPVATEFPAGRER